VSRDGAECPRDTLGGVQRGCAVASTAKRRRPECRSEALDARSERLGLADDRAETLGLRCVQKHVGRADPRKGFAPAYGSDEACVDALRAREAFERGTLRAVPHDDERAPLVGRARAHESDGAIESFRGDESAHAHREARPRERLASLGGRRGHVGQLDRRRANLRHALDRSARFAIERRRQVIEEHVRNERPRACGEGEGPHDPAAGHRGQRAKKPHVAPVRHDLELVVARPCDGKSRRYRPVGDHAVGAERGERAASGRDPSHGLPGSRRSFPNARGGARPPECAAGPGRDHRHAVAFALERARVRANEVARGVVFGFGPARRDDRDVQWTLLAAMVRDTKMSASSVRFGGRVLFLTEDPALIDAQLAGRDLDYDPERPLLSNISTDEIIPSWACYYYDETLGEYCLVGLRGGRIQPGAIRRGGFSVVVSGPSKGCGSSRETAPYSEVAAGIQLVIAASLEKIYRQNAQNIGLATSTDFGLVPRILRGESIEATELTKGLDPISAAIASNGGLLAYSRARLAGAATAPRVTTPRRPMTLCEKIIARHVVVDAANGSAEGAGERVGVEAVRPGDAIFARCDVRFSHDYVTPMAEALFRRGFGAEARIDDPESVFLFRDHLTFLDAVMPPAHRAMGLDVQAAKLALVQEDFARRRGLQLYGEVVENGRLMGSEAICHNKIVEDIALPGQLVLGTDSHTCMAGALGALAFGVGSTDMANAWRTRDVRITVPETVRIVLRGSLRPGVSAKDVMLHLLSLPFFRSGQAIGRVLEFAGDGTRGLAFDERATLANMAVEGGAFTGIVEADAATAAHLAAQRHLASQDVESRIVRADPDAEYGATLELDLASCTPTVALPGDPRNGVPLAGLSAPVRVDIAYGGSCTGGKKADMDMYASVLSAALAKGKRVAPGVELFIQFGSQAIRRYASERGYEEVFARAGATTIGPSCGACIKAGPGVSQSADQVTVSAQNRNYPGRSGPGAVYLASPFVVAASAVLGRIGSPDEI
jgi:3-isopropylmalate/(R)-2-methylmalate dehydratase large subunit